MADLVFFELAPSPNNVKVRLGLRFKGLEFEAMPVEPGSDRAEVRQVSGQVLTPVLQDKAKGVVITDSEAILQYLDANYRDTPRLFPAERDGRKAVDAFDEQLQKTLAKPWGEVFRFIIGQFYGHEVTLDPGSVNRFHDGLAGLEAKLESSDTFAEGQDQAINDLRAAEWAVYGLPGEGIKQRVPHFAKFEEVYAVERGKYPRLEAFLARWNGYLA